MATVRLYGVMRRHWDSCTCNQYFYHQSRAHMLRNPLIQMVVEDVTLDVPNNDNSKAEVAHVACVQDIFAFLELSQFRQLSVRCVLIKH
jgi:hypothetical protein